MLGYVDQNPPAKDVVALIKALELHEYNVLKYRTRGDSSAEWGMGRSSTEYHAIASKESQLAQDLMNQLANILGPDGGPGLPIAGVLRLASKQAEFLTSVDDVDSFEAACFFKRHPKWAEKSAKHREAHRRWANIPVLPAMAPEYLPIWRSWTE